ncbi:MAG: HD domain-containing protein, partial [Candidatus Electrothrix sp. AR1]|nr:HD domain-containing protein [Candidatus Electrothrix sp. AR1]
INFFVVQKIAFLNFYYLPVIISGHYLGTRRTILSAILCITFIVLYFLIFPDNFTVTCNKQDVFIHLTAWGSFLILSGAVVGRLQEKLQRETSTTLQLNEKLVEHQEELRQINLSLQENTGDLENKVRQRTSELEESRNMLETMKSKVEEALYSTMDATVAKLIIEGRLRDEKRKISVMFTDLTGFTAYSETRQPELVTRDLNQYFSEMEKIMFAYNAHIDKYQGDGIMCEFGTPLDFAQYRLMAVVCAIKMQEKMAAQSYPWRMRIGISSGMAIVGLIGAKRQSYTTIGDVVNLASRFESACPPGAILIDNTTMEGVRPFIDAKLKHDVDLSDSLVIEIRKKIEKTGDKLSRLNNDYAKADLYHQLGQLHLEIMEADEAASCFEKALQLKPEDTNLKVAFAEATLHKDDSCKIQIKGKRKRVAAYEVIGLKDILQDRGKITLEFYNKYKHAVKLINIPEDVILPSEVLDGRVGHGKMVALLSYAIADELGIESEQKKNTILQAGFLADVGLEGIPHHLLNRSKGGLSSDEYQEFLRHGIESTRILKKNGYQEELLLEIIYHSHEKYDGSGFPSGLKGKNIPLGSRIIAVADTYDTLTSWHSSRERWDMKAAFHELQRGAEKGDFDPEVVQALLDILI